MFTFLDYGDVLVSSGMVQSMSRKGNCCDNAPTESFLHTLKTERVHHCPYATSGGKKRPVPLHRRLLQSTPPPFRAQLSDAGTNREKGALTTRPFFRRKIIIETATLNGLDPEAYLRDIITRIADHPI
jgi:transposase InsO family protein